MWTALLATGLWLVIVSLAVYGLCLRSADDRRRIDVLERDADTLHRKLYGPVKITDPGDRFPYRTEGGDW